MKLFALLLLTTNAFAGFTGSFSGQGEAVFASGRRWPCHEVFLRIETRPGLFRLREGGYNCGELLNANFDPFKMTIRDGSLFDHDTKLGTITDQELDYRIYDPEDGSTYHLKLKKIDDDIQYFEEWHDGEKIALTVKGKLSKIKP